ncbi:putative c-type cytochrome [Caenispirillum salinarum AK4]|uniref:Putative c-type cytochrome n=1 Tax=Caenispirillum salinarum AK4 TaxID=1238182 RepID=K9HQA1_9PROT|nr:c-type cytochrome [Caenispirillum salinarum]EKV32468.1 putative c-type cytochrome [Caenispirillum salinarum AK4]
MRIPLLLAVVLALSAAIVSWLSDTGRLLADTHVAVTPDAVADGGRLYAENCAACHGSGVDNPPGWRPVIGGIAPPPLTADGLPTDSTDGYLVRVIREGAAAVHGDPARHRMPPFRDVLTNREIHAVVAFLKDRWPDHLQALRGADGAVNGGG